MSSAILDERKLVRARFRLNVICANCRRTFVHDLDAPNVEDAPEDIDDLIGSELLARQQFACPKCESGIGLVAAIRKLGEG